MEAAAKHLSSATLELGGKSPVIIDASADLTDTAEKIAWGKFINAGQTCIAPDYIMVHQSIRSEFIDELRMAIDRLFDDQGLGMEHSKAYARVVSSDHFQRLSGMIQEAVAQGARIEYGGNTNEAQCYIDPTVLSNPDPASQVLQEEIFGPILPVTEYEDLDKAIEYINQRPKPLALYVFSSKKSTQNKILNETSSGSAAVNDCVIQFMNPNLPFGGVSNSGFGKSHGETGFIAFSNQKSVLKQRQGMTSIKPVYPPYTEFAHKAIEMLIRYF
jgi:aldehyde dehydrogenase (NAD+)